MTFGNPRTAGVAAVVGGVLWGLTPLRQPVFDAGSTPDEGLALFRAYNVLLIVVMSLLTVALFHVRSQMRSSGRPRGGYRVGWWTVLVGHALVALGSATGVILGDRAENWVTAGQDLGFLGAMLAALGAIPLGLSQLKGGVLPRTAAALLALALPLGLVLLLALSAAGVHEDFLGLPLTVLYGAGWALAGVAWIAADRSPSTM